MYETVSKIDLIPPVASWTPSGYFHGSLERQGDELSSFSSTWRCYKEAWPYALWGPVFKVCVKLLGWWYPEVWAEEWLMTPSSTCYLILGIELGLGKHVDAQSRQNGWLLGEFNLNGVVHIVRKQAYRLGVLLERGKAMAVSRSIFVHPPLTCCYWITKGCCGSCTGFWFNPKWGLSDLKSSVAWALYSKGCVKLPVH